MPPSGPEWVNQFPTSASVDDLVEPFRGKVLSFLDALDTAGATVTISATLRPPQRADLMYYAFNIANRTLDPTDSDQVPPIPGANIQWVHLDDDGQPDLGASQGAAQAMVHAYDIVYEPASPNTPSRHTQGLAIDMTITWEGDLVITNGEGAFQTIAGGPQNGGENTDLHRIGSSFGVIKLVTDHPHWSSDGR